MTKNDKHGQNAAFPDEFGNAPAKDPPRSWDHSDIIGILCWLLPHKLLIKTPPKSPRCGVWIRAPSVEEKQTKPQWTVGAGGVHINSLWARFKALARPSGSVKMGCDKWGLSDASASGLRWAKSCESHRRIASESYRSDSNHWRSYLPLETQNLVS